MKVLIVSHACALPLNQQMYSIASNLRKWEVSLVAPRRWKAEYGNYLEARLFPGFEAKIVTADVFMDGSIPLHVYRMRATKLLRQLRPDVIYVANEPYALSTLQWCRANQKTGAKPFGFYSAQNLVKRYPIPFRQSEEWVLRNSTFALPITNEVQQVLLTKHFKGVSTVLPLGFDPELYQATKCIVTRHRAASSSTFHFAFVGRVVEEKGLLTVARALSRLRDVSWKLIIVGAGPFESEIKAELATGGVADRVEWRGFMPHVEVARFYETVDCLLLPSETRPNWKEQFGRVLIESMACGTPVIGSDSGEIPHIIRDTRGGLVFKEADPNACESVMRQMITQTEQRTEMARSGHDYVHRHYALPALADRFADTIDAAARLS